MSVRFIPASIISAYDAITSLNGNFTSIATWLDRFVLRDGTEANSMSRDLDMNHFNIQNVEDGVSNTDAVNLGQLQSFTLGSLNLGVFSTSPNYTNDSTHSSLIIAQGTSGTPVTSSGASVVVQKTSNTTVFDSFASMAFKKSSNSNARATAIFAEASDTAGGITTFCEGIRAQATLVSGANGSSYGGVLVAGTGASPTTPAYIIGCESVVDDQVGPDASDYTTFNLNKYRAAFVATCGDFGGTLYKADAAFVTNPFSTKAFRTGMLFTSGSVDHTLIAARSGISVVNGIDLSLATISSAAFKSSGFVVNADGTLTLTEIAAASVATPAATKQTLFIDTADHKLKRKDSTGTVTIIA